MKKISIVTIAITLLLTVIAMLGMGYGIIEIFKYTLVDIPPEYNDLEISHVEVEGLERKLKHLGKHSNVYVYDIITSSRTYRIAVEYNKYEIEDQIQIGDRLSVKWFDGVFADYACEVVNGNTAVVTYDSFGDTELTVSSTVWGFLFAAIGTIIFFVAISLIKEDGRNKPRLTDKRITLKKERYRAFRKRAIYEGFGSGIIGEFSERDSERAKVRFSRLTGTYVCNAYLGNGNAVDYNLWVEYKSGELRIILTDENGKIIFELTPKARSGVSFIAKHSETYYLKIAGNKAYVDVRLERSEKSKV